MACTIATVRCKQRRSAMSPQALIVATRQSSQAQVQVHKLPNVCCCRG